MATIANWNGHTFEVSPNLIRGFTDLTIKGSCETTTKNSNKQKYVKRKYGEVPEISMVVGLSALTGVTNVMSEAMAFISEATAGKTAYFYMGTKKLLTAKMMLVSAEVVEVVNMPGSGDAWISCNVKLTFKQGAKSGKSSNKKDSGSSNKASVRRQNTTNTSSKPKEEKTTYKNNQEQSADIHNYNSTLEWAKANQVNAQAKAASNETKQNPVVKVATALTDWASKLTKNTTTTSNSATRTSPTTGRMTGPTDRVQ